METQHGYLQSSHRGCLFNIGKHWQALPSSVPRGRGASQSFSDYCAPSCCDSTRQTQTLAPNSTDSNPSEVNLKGRVERWLKSLHVPDSLPSIPFHSATYRSISSDPRPIHLFFLRRILRPQFPSTSGFSIRPKAFSVAAISEPHPA